MKTEISLDELVVLLKQNVDTVWRYVNAGYLPSPFSADPCLFSRLELAEAIGVPDLNEDFILIDEASKILGLKPATIRSRCAVKRYPLPHYKIIESRGSPYLFRRSELNKYKERMKVRNRHKEQEEKDRLMRKISASVIEAMLASGAVSDSKAVIFYQYLVEDKPLAELANGHGRSKESIRQTLIKMKNGTDVWLSILKDGVVCSKKEFGAALRRANS